MSKTALMMTRPSGATAPAVLADDGALIAATSDEQAVRLWLHERERSGSSPATLKRYGQLAWRWLSFLQDRGVMLAAVPYEAVVAFEADLRHGQVSSNGWVAQNARSADASMRIIGGGLMRWLVAARYVRDNPFDLRLASRPDRSPKRVSRVMSQQTLDAVQAFLDERAALTPAGPGREALVRRHHGTAWLFAFVRELGLRRSDVPAAKLGHLVEDRGRLFLRLVGKGQVTADLPVLPSLQQRWEAFLAVMGADPLPLSQLAQREPEFPALPGPGARFGQPSHPLTDSAVARRIKQAFADTRLSLLSGGIPDSDLRVRQLASASPHWIRHGRLSELMLTLPILMVRDMGRHANIATTNTYSHVERDALYDALVKAVRHG